MEPRTLEDLQRAMQENARGAGRLQGLEDQYAQADALRNKEVDPRNALSSIATVMRRGQARKQLQGIEPQLQQARSQQAQGEADIQFEGLRRARATEELQAAQRQDALAQQDVKNQREEERMALDWYRAKTDRMGELPAGDSPRMKLEDVKRGQKSGKNMSDSDKTKMLESVDQSVMLTELRKQWHNDYARPGGMPTGKLNQAMFELSKQGLLGYVAPGLDKSIREGGRDWWSKYMQHYELGKKHELFGSAFTANEANTWDKAMSIFQGGDPEEIKQSLQELDYITKKHMISNMRAKMAGATYNDYMTMKTKMQDLGFKIIGDLSSEDEGLVQMDDETLKVGMELEQRWAAETAARNNAPPNVAKPQTPQGGPPPGGPPNVAQSAAPAPQPAPEQAAPVQFKPGMVMQGMVLNKLPASDPNNWSPVQ